MKHKITALMMTAILAGTMAVNASALSYPIAVQYPTTEGGLICKTYAVKTVEEIESLDHGDIEYQGTVYHFQDMTVEELPFHDEKNYIQTVTGESDTKDSAAILALLDVQKEVSTEDGYIGTLDIDTSSLTTEVTAYGSTSKTKTVTRTYNGLSGADLSFIPKTVTDSGVTCSLVDVAWTENTTYNPYDSEQGTHFDATATYSGTYSSKYAKGYSYEVKYYGMVEKDEIQGYNCTLMFAPEITEDHWYDVFVGEKANPVAVFFGIALFIVLLMCAVYTIVSLIKRGKSQAVTTTEEEYIIEDEDGTGADT